jgi:hypothetical protein
MDLACLSHEYSHTIGRHCSKWEAALKAILAIGLLALGVAASVPARADYSVVRYGDHYCRVWWDSSAKPEAGKLLTWKHKVVHTGTWDGADKDLHKVVAAKWCHH